MSEEDAEEQPAVELGDHPPVEGAPLARVASRLSWPRGKSDVIVQEGETSIRTGDGPRTLEAILEDVETPYFATRQEFVADVRDAIGYGPVPSSDD